MNSITAMNYGIQTIQQGFAGLRSDANAIANANQPGSADITRPLVHLSQDRLEVAMGAKVIKAADDTIGTLLDIMA